ncbi:hypothetical protein IPJ72_00590 [Candidatus Peregrinibacteria bacterium]|nr:MAG: hypothetical protein IPJ72_00590 [Candidatus Peregrinibacteria bacterium]
MSESRFAFDRVCAAVKDARVMNPTHVHNVLQMFREQIDQANDAASLHALLLTCLTLPDGDRPKNPGDFLPFSTRNFTVPELLDAPAPPPARERLRAALDQHFFGPGRKD